MISLANEELGSSQKWESTRFFVLGNKKRVSTVLYRWADGKPNNFR